METGRQGANSSSPCLPVSLSLLGIYFNLQIVGIPPGLLMPDPIASARTKREAARPRGHKAGRQPSSPKLPIAPAAIRQRPHLHIERSYATYIIGAVPAHQEAAIALPFRRCHTRIGRG